MSHFTVLVCVSVPQIADKAQFRTALENAVYERLAPYDGNTEEEDYLEFDDQTDDEREQYENRGIDCVRMVDGRILPAYDSAFTHRYELFEGTVYRRSFGQLRHRKRTADARRIEFLPDYPFKKLYSSFEEYMRRYQGMAPNDEGRYGYYVNPDCHWDWYQIGGRWPYSFLVKDGCPSAFFDHELTLSDQLPKGNAPDGYAWASCARKSDIAWETMRELRREGFTKGFHQFAKWFQAGSIPDEHRFDFRLHENGITSWGELLYREGETLEEYLEKNGLSDSYRYSPDTYAILDDQGWESSGEMGWFGYSSNNKGQNVWNRMVEEFIDRQPDDTMLVSVDCHI